MRRISIGTGSRARIDFEALRERAREAEDNGVDTIFVVESWGADATILLAVLAQCTTRVRLGTSIVNNFSRTPAALAMQFATLDQLSQGRMLLGLGTSGPQVVEELHGIPFEKPVTRMGEYIQIINMLMRGEPLHFKGKIFDVDRGFTFRGLEPYRDHIPIWVGSMAPRSVEQTARLADGWFPSHVPQDQWVKVAREFRAMVAAAGRDPESLELKAPGGIQITNDPDTAYQRSRETQAFYMARMGELHYEQYKRMGLAEEADAVRVAWRNGGSKAGQVALPIEAAKSLSYAGGVQGAIEYMEEQREAGYDLFSVSVDEPDEKKRHAIYRQLVG